MGLQNNTRLEGFAEGRPCFREPIPEIDLAASYLNEAVSAHFSNGPDRAEELIKLADIPAIGEWGESLWGKNSPYVQRRDVADAPLPVPRAERMKRLPTMAEQAGLHLRDGYRCRFCGIPVIRRQVRDRFCKLYPEVARWGKTNESQHTALQTMWAQYDHILPHSRGGSTLLDNLVVTCAPCNFGRVHYTLAEVGLADPRTREPIRSEWDGLERFLKTKAA